MAELIQPDGTTTHVEPASNKFTGDELRQYIGCQYFEAVSLPDGRTMWFDESGKDLGKPVNALATRLLREYGGFPADYVAGDVLVTDRNEVE